MSVTEKDLFAYRASISRLGTWNQLRRDEINALCEGVARLPVGVKRGQYCDELWRFISRQDFGEHPDDFAQAIALLQKHQHDNFLELVRSYHGILYDHTLGREVELTGQWPQREN